MKSIRIEIIDTLFTPKTSIILIFLTCQMNRPTQILAQTLHKKRHYQHLLVLFQSIESN